jgi:hypothetical protein
MQFKGWVTRRLSRAMGQLNATCTAPPGVVAHPVGGEVRRGAAVKHGDAARLDLRLEDVHRGVPLRVGAHSLPGVTQIGYMERNIPAVIN